MKHRYILLIVFLFNCLGYQIISQQDAQYTQYMFNTISVNPAYAGSRNVTSIMGLHRSQWVGLDGSPRTQTLTADTALGEEGRVGLGLSVINDEIGPTDETYFDLNFSYSIYTSDTGTLAFGLKAGGHLLNVDLIGLSQYNLNDALFERNIDNKFSPQVGLGIYYSTKKLYLGISAPNLLETKHFDESATSSDSSSANFLSEERINFYVITGYVFDMNDRVKFKPAILLKALPGAPVQVDISANFLINTRFRAGLAYRVGASLSAMAGFQVSESMMIGMAYDRETTQLGNVQFNNGSYEIMLRYELFKQYNRMLTPRFF